MTKQILLLFLPLISLNLFAQDYTKVYSYNEVILSHAKEVASIVKDGTGASESASTKLKSYETGMPKLAFSIAEDLVYYFSENPQAAEIKKAFENDDFTKAIKAAKALCDKKQSAADFVTLSNLKLADYDLAGAKASLSDGLANFPNSSILFINQGVITDVIEQKGEEAGVLFEQALANAENDNDKAIANLHLGRLYSNLPDPMMAEKHFFSAASFYKQHNSAQYAKVLLNYSVLLKRMIEATPSITSYEKALTVTLEAKELTATLSHPQAKAWEQQAAYMNLYFQGMDVSLIKIKSSADSLSAVAEQVTDTDPERANLLFKEAIRYYNKAFDKDPDFTLLVTLSSVYEKLNLVEKDPKAVISNLQLVIENKKSILKQFNGNTDAKKSLALSTGQLSWALMEDFQFKEAKLYALKSNLLDNNQLWLKSVLAIAYILNDEYDKAEAIYTQLKHVKLTDGSFAKSLFLSNITEIESAGVVKATFDKAKNILSE